MTTVILIFVILGWILTFVCYGALMVELGKMKDKIIKTIDDDTSEALTFIYKMDEVKEKVSEEGKADVG